MAKSGGPLPLTFLRPWTTVQISACLRANLIVCSTGVATVLSSKNHHWKAHGPLLLFSFVFVLRRILAARRGEVGGGVCGASLGLQMGKTRQKYIHGRNFTSFFKQITADSHNFHFRLLQTLCIQNLSNCCWHNYDASISRVFSKINFWRVFPHLAKLCAWGEKRLDVCRQRRLSLFVSDFYVCIVRYLLYNIYYYTLFV